MSEFDIMRVWEQADAVDQYEGMLAYERYHDTMQRIAAAYQFPFKSVVGAFCALSPNNDYVGNLRSLVTLLKGWENGFAAEKLTVSTYNACKFRAWRCLAGEDFLSFTKGPKTRAFYHNILDPSDDAYITIDGHMYCVWAGKRMTMVAVAWQRFNYKHVELDFKRCAFRLGIRPCQLQGVLWFTWKRINRVLFDGQLKMFERDDQWGLLPDVTTIATYPVKESL